MNGSAKMNKPPVEVMYEAMRAKWVGNTVEWNRLHPVQQHMLIQAFNTIINVMEHQNET